MYSGLDFIMSVCSLHEVMDGRVQVGCDNEKYLLLLSRKVQMVRQQRKRAYILQAILKVQTYIPLALEFNHIHGNKDKSIPDQLMESQSQINIK